MRSRFPVSAEPCPWSPALLSAGLVSVLWVCPTPVIPAPSSMRMGIPVHVPGEREELELLFKLRLRRKRSPRDFYQRAEHEGMCGACVGHVWAMPEAHLLPGQGNTTAALCCSTGAGAVCLSWFKVWRSPKVEWTGITSNPSPPLECTCWQPCRRRL